MKVLAAIAAHREERGYPPTMRDVANRTGLAFGSMHYQITVLTRDRLIERSPGVSRSLRLTENGEIRLEQATRYRAVAAQMRLTLA